VFSGKSFLRRSALWLGLILVAALAALAWRQPPTGQTYGTFAQFLGRFHPILVHLPIGLLILVPVLELAGAFGRRDDLRSAAGFVLAFAAIGALAAALAGWLLARHGGYAGPLVVRHMWCGVALAGLCLVAVAVRPYFAAEPGRWPGFVFLYGPLLLASVALMVWTSHQGGGITHGETFLTDQMPAPLRTWLGVPAPFSSPPAVAAAPSGGQTLYGARIAPIFNRSCVSCHGPAKVKGDLRLDSYAGLLRGGKGGDEVIPWQPGQSELVRRLILPAEDDDHMPSDHKHPLTADEIQLVEQWIAAGASAQQPLVIAPISADQ
jgi:uncharacterized membrane protein